MNLRQAAHRALKAMEDGEDRADMIEFSDALIALRAALAEPECKCTMAQKMVGDGCAVCNPERAKDLAKPEQDPVIWADLNEDGEVIRFRYYSDGNPNEVALYEARTA